MIGPFDTPTALLIAELIVVLAYGVYVLFGFGSALIAVGLMALVMPVQDGVVLVMLLGIPIELVVLIRERHEIAWKSAGKLILAVGVFVPIGALVLGWGKPLFLLTLLGIALVLFGAWFLYRESKGDQSADVPGWTRWPAGALAGFLGGLFGTSGPPLVAYLHALRVDRRQFRLTLFVVFQAIGWIRVVTYTATGLITVDRLLGTAILVPGAAIGALIGSRLHVSISESLFRRAVSVALIVIGVSLVLPGLI